MVHWQTRTHRHSVIGRNSHLHGVRSSTSRPLASMHLAARFGVCARVYARFFKGQLAALAVSSRKASTVPGSMRASLRYWRQC